MGSATRQTWHVVEWAELVELETLAGVLNGILGKPGQHYVACGAGGDFVGGGCGPENWQALHDDLAHVPNARDHPFPPMVSVSFVVDADGLTWENGPVRIIPGTHWDKPGQGSRNTPPSWDEEPEEYWTSTLCPLSCGTAIIRDMRCWHGGTPNVSHQIRYLPAVEYAAPWSNAEDCPPRKVYRRHNLRTMPRRIFDSFGDRGEKLCRLVVDWETVD